MLATLMLFGLIMIKLHFQHPTEKFSSFKTKKLNSKNLQKEVYLIYIKDRSIFLQIKKKKFFFFIFKRYIPRVLENKEDKIPIDCMCPFSKGLIIGCDAGNFAVWMKNDEPDMNFTSTGKEKNADQLYYVKEWSDKKASGVTAMDISKNEETLVIAFKNN